MKKFLFVLAAFGVLFMVGTADRPMAFGLQNTTRPGLGPILETQTGSPPALRKPATIRNFGKVPVYFIPNDGQMDRMVEFYVQGKDKALYFTPEGVTYALNYGQKPASAEQKRWAVKMDFIGARQDIKPEGVEKTGAVISYFKGNPEEWHAGLAAYSKIIYRDLWPGIDLVYKGDIDKLKYEFIVHPGADPAAIKIALRGAEKAAIDLNGRLEIATPAGSFHDETPQAYQNVDGKRTEVPMAFKLAEEHNFQKASTGLKSYSYRFEIGDYDHSRELILDPATIVYCGYIGGSGDDRAQAIAVDESGNAYITGYAKSTEATFPKTGGPDLTQNGNEDAFVAKVRYDGTSVYLVYCGYIGGVSDEVGHSIAVDGSGNAYITGYTESSEATFPEKIGPDLTYNGGTADAFVAKINPAGTSLVYCGYIGGAAAECGFGTAVDASGNAYVAGYTLSTEATFPKVVGPDLGQNGGSDAFLAKVNSSGSGLVYCGFIGGSGDERAMGVAIDGSGNTYIAGYAYSTEATFPETVGPDTTHNGYADAFVAKVKADGTGLTYCGYIGGSAYDYGDAIAVDGSGNAYITGYTSSTAATFPVSVGPGLTYKGSQDAYIAKVKADGTGLVYCGYIGGSYGDYGQGIAVDSSGNAYVAGYTYSTETTFPVTLGPSLTQGGNDDAFVAKVRPDGHDFVYCGFVGGSAYDFGMGIALDASGNVYIAGGAGSTQATFPVSLGPDLTQNGDYDAFVAKIQNGVNLTIAAGTGGTTDPSPGTRKYDEGTVVTVQALPTGGYGFDHWTGDVPAGQETNATISVTMDANKSLTASFKKIWTLTITSATGGTTNPAAGAYSYSDGAVVQITAIPADRYQFDSWSGDVPAASATSNPLSLTMNANKSIQPNFSLAVKPALNLTGEKLANRSVSQVEYIARLRWQANSANSGTISYRVYQIEGGVATLAADVPAGGLEYIVRRLERTKAYRFGITAVNSQGWESDRVEVNVQ
jgi:hypothetical protein